MSRDAASGTGTEGEDVGKGVSLHTGQQVPTRQKRSVDKC
jgi:hypothetical protein